MTKLTIPKKLVKHNVLSPHAPKPSTHTDTHTQTHAPTPGLYVQLGPALGEVSEHLILSPDKREHQILDTLPFWWGRWSVAADEPPCRKEREALPLPLVSNFPWKTSSKLPAGPEAVPGSTAPPGALSNQGRAFCVSVEVTGGIRRHPRRAVQEGCQNSLCTPYGPTVSLHLCGLFSSFSGYSLHMPPPQSASHWSCTNTISEVPIWVPRMRLMRLMWQAVSLQCAKAVPVC